MALRLVPMLQARKMVSKPNRVTRSRLKADFILGELSSSLGHFSVNLVVLFILGAEFAFKS